MSPQQLIYETAVPVSSGRHGRVSVLTGQDYGHCRRVNSVPLMAVEFAPALQDYAIVFAQNGDAVVPVVVLGARKDQNLFIAADGQWQAGYIPAFVRRYPFVFSASADGQSFTLCVDEAYTGVNWQGRGQALFQADGKPTPYVDGVLQFLQEYRAQFLRTQAFCARLQTLQLLEPMQAQFSLGTGEQMALTGFLAVDRSKLKALAGDALATLLQSDELELIYLHLQSLHNFGALKDKLVRSAPAVADAAAPAVVDAAAEPAATTPAATSAETSAA